MQGLRRVGSEGAPWTVPLDEFDSSSVCYLAGVGEDITFDIALVEQARCKAHSFDPTPRAATHIESLNLPDGYTFHKFGIWSSDTTLKFFAPENPSNVSHSILNLQRTEEYFEAGVRRLKSIMDELGHTELDLLKIDIEGAEYEVLESIIEDDLKIKYLCVDFDQPYPIIKTLIMLRRLRRHGYLPVAVDGWDISFAFKSPVK
ncbi:MAG: FkbM family methyltransferase [Chloroflexi bacterium]|nr:FkbM family methyltransferase [Chloroflexota bacterium]